jgi:hypothetical protein
LEIQIPHQVAYSTVLSYPGQRIEELDVTSRDVFLDALWTKSGVLTRPTDLQRHWNFIEGIELRRGRLVWRMGPAREVRQGLLHDGSLARRAIHMRQQAEHDGHRILDEFIALAERSGSAILEFAKTWGVLELCQHHLPHLHSIPHEYLRLPPPGPVFTSRPRTNSACFPLGVEPLEVWRFFSRQAKALLRIAANLQQERLGEPDDWSLVLRARVAPKQDVRSQWVCWDDAVDSWMTLGDVRPRIDHTNRGITWAGADLFGELAVQLALAGVMAEGQVHCTNCGRPYPPKKQITRGGVHYCPRVRCQKVAGAYRAARYRGNKSESAREKRDARKFRFRGVFDGRTNDPLFS